MTIIEALRILRKKVPEGYTVIIRTIKDKTEVELETPDGTQSVSSEGNITEQLFSALDQAIDDAEPFNDEI